MRRLSVLLAVLATSLVAISAVAQPATPTVGDPAANKALMQRYFAEFWNQGITAVADELVASDAEYTELGQPPAIGPEGRKAARAEIATAFPDFRVTILEQVAEEDRVATLWLFEGTHTGPLGDLPASGTKVAIEGMQIDRIAGGQIVASHQVRAGEISLVIKLG